MIEVIDVRPIHTWAALDVQAVQEVAESLALVLGRHAAERSPS